MFNAGRKRTNTAAGNADHEFLEKRWSHERQLKEKAIEVELEKIALRREELQIKDRKSERKYNFRQSKMEKECKLREREMELRERELKQREQLNEILSSNQQALLRVVDTLTSKVSLQ